MARGDTSVQDEPADSSRDNDADVSTAGFGDGNSRRRFTADGYDGAFSGAQKATAKETEEIEIRTRLVKGSVNCETRMEQSKAL